MMMKFLDGFLVWLGWKPASSQPSPVESGYKLLWNRWVAGVELVTCSGRISVRFYKCMVAGAARPQVIVVIDASDASTAMARKAVAALKRELNHFGKLLDKVSFDGMKAGEVALLTNIHSASEACAFVDRVKSASI